MSERVYQSARKEREREKAGAKKKSQENQASEIEKSTMRHEEEGEEVG